MDPESMRMVANTDRMLSGFGPLVLPVFQPVVSTSVSGGPCQQHKQGITQKEPMSHAIGCTLLKEGSSLSQDSSPEPASQWWLLGQQEARRMLLLSGRRGSPSMQPAWGEHLPLAKVCRLVRNRSNLAGLVSATKRALQDQAPVFCLMLQLA